MKNIKLRRLHFQTHHLGGEHHLLSDSSCSGFCSLEKASQSAMGMGRLVKHCGLLRIWFSCGWFKNKKSRSDLIKVCFSPK